MLETVPAAVLEQALQGSDAVYTVNAENSVVCVHVLGVDVTLTRVQFNVVGVDFVRITLYKPDGKTPLVGQVRLFLLAKR
jgi:hypothetical protein